MSIPSRFRSQYTGKEIDELLASISGKIDSSIISLDIEENDPNKVPATTITRNLYDQLQLFRDPSYILGIIQTLPGNNVFTDAYRLKLDSLNTQFKGAFLNRTSRNTALDSGNFSGGELTFILDDGDDGQAWDYWDNQTLSWKPAKLFKQGYENPIDAPTATTIRFAAFDVNSYTGCEFVVSAINNTKTNVAVTKILAAVDGTNSYSCTSNFIGTNPIDPTSVIDVYSSLETVGGVTSLVIYVDTKIPNLTVKGVRLGAF